MTANTSSRRGTAAVHQERALATRAKIIDAAVELFDTNGYGETNLAEILDLAGITKGAYYYHFDAKVDVAAAIIDESKSRIDAAIAKDVKGCGPVLEDMIRSTFITAETLRTDRLTHVGNLLAQSLTQISSAGSRMYLDWTPAVTAALIRAAAEGDVREGVDPAELAQTIWMTIVGCHLLADALDDSRIGRLTVAWQTLLPTIVPKQKLAYFSEFVSRVAQHY